MEILKRKELPFGISCCYTSASAEIIGSEEYFDYMIDLGAKFAWLFTYMPVGKDAVTELMATAEQRENINANGDIEPCAFIHYSDSNIREKTLLEAHRSGLFMGYHDNQPFNENLLRPCSALDNPGRLTELVERSGAKRWAPVAERL